MLDVMAFYVEMFVLIHHLGLVPALAAILLKSYDLVAIAIDALKGIILHAHVHVSLGVHKQLLFIFGIIEADLIISLPSRCRIGLEPANLIVIFVLPIWAFPQIWRHLVRVI